MTTNIPEKGVVDVKQTGLTIDAERQIKTGDTARFEGVLNALSNGNILEAWGGTENSVGPSVAMFEFSIPIVLFWESVGPAKISPVLHLQYFACFSALILRLSFPPYIQSLCLSMFNAMSMGGMSNSKHRHSVDLSSRVSRSSLKARVILYTYRRAL